MAIKLKNVQHVKLKDLRPNKHNAGLFLPESGLYFNRLEADIKKRGIQVPLVAKPDGTLLAGHNRLLVARTLGLKTVPVQYVAGKLTHEQEVEYIIKDNILRRHLTPGERDALYRKIVPDFDERVMVKNARGVSVDVKKLAETTGLNPQTIGFDLARNRRTITRKAKTVADSGAPNEREIDIFKRALARALNIAIAEKGATLAEVKRLLLVSIDRLLLSSQDVRQ